MVLRPSAGNGLSATGALRTRGIRQEIQTDTKAEKLFAYPDARAAVIRIDRGKGAVYYSAASLENSTYSKLLDALFDKAGVTRPVRVIALDSGAPGNIESRFAEAGNRKLLYVVNFGAAAARLRVKAPQGFFSGLRELRGEMSSAGGTISVAAGETKIYEMF